MVAYVRKEDAPTLAPPPNLLGLGASLRQKFFSTPVSGVIGVLVAALVAYVVWTMADRSIILCVTPYDSCLQDV